MLSNIEQAVVDLLDREKAITVPNVFSAYMQIAGLDVDAIEEAVITFERAMDKHAVRPDAVQSPMIVELRNQYWYTKLGGCKDGEGVCHTCESCGGMRLHGKNGRRAVGPPPIASATTPPKLHRAPPRGETCF
jgi:hypothetical protein